MDESKLVSGKFQVFILSLVSVGLFAIFFGATSEFVLGSNLTWEKVNQEIAGDFPKTPFISVNKLAALLEAPDKTQLLLIDARSPEEYAVSHLRGSLRLDSETLNSEKLKQQAAKHTLIVVYCSVGYRSAKLAQRLLDAGFSQIYNAQGGIFAWANDGRPVYRGTEQVSEVHPYDSYWGQLLHEHLHSTNLLSHM